MKRSSNRISYCVLLFSVHLPVAVPRPVYGGWEMDTIVGPGNKDAMLTLVERSQGYSIIARLPKGKDADGLLRVAYREQIQYKINARPRKNSDSRHWYTLFSYLCRHSCILELNLRDHNL